MRIRIIALVTLLAVGCSSTTDVATAPAVERETDAPTTAPPTTSTVAEATTSTTAPTASTTAPTTTRPTAPRGASGGAGASQGARLAGDGTPTFEGDFADPFLLEIDGTFYAYATNTLAFNVPVLIAGGDGTAGSGGDALPELPAWSERFNTWAPSVTPIGDGYVMHYTTRHTESGRQCISVAVSDEPAGPFVDTSTEPLICALDQGGAIDPSVVIDGTDVWLLWKSDGNCCGWPTVLYAQPLTDDGLELAGDPVELLRNDLGWERDVIEGPSMIENDGAWHLFYSANRWDTADYAVGHAVCESVAGPCLKDSEPWLETSDLTAGPGGLEVMAFDGRALDLVVYHGWTGDIVGYPEGKRSLYVRPIRWIDGAPVLVDRASD